METVDGAVVFTNGPGSIYRPTGDCDTPGFTAVNGMDKSGMDESDESDIALQEHDRYRANQLRRKARRAGYSTDDLAWYSTDTLRTLVEACLGGFTPMPPADTVRGGDPAEGGNIQAALADCQRGLYKLMDPSHRATLLLHHGGAIEATPEALDAAYTALQAVLGGRRPQGI